MGPYGREVEGRVLIDSDLGARGIWRIAPAAETNAPDVATWRAIRAANNPPAFESLLSASLLADLQSWNDNGDPLYGGRAVDSDETRAARQRYRLEGKHLAERVQDELGPRWEVLYNGGVDGWAWTFVLPYWTTEPSDSLSEFG
ncbi:MAG: hypothetical protein JWM85_1556 [Acidimicrobiaceae bacterium]|nr:hypothetical protein [Acidimicrobiaceae bacterium]